MTRRISTVLLWSITFVALLLVQGVVMNIPAHSQAQRPSIQVAFVRHGNIWLLDAATSHRIRLTSDGRDNGPTWAAGSKVLFFQRTVGNRV